MLTGSRAAAAGRLHRGPRDGQHLAGHRHRRGRRARPRPRPRGRPGRRTAGRGGDARAGRRGARRARPDAPLAREGPGLLRRRPVRGRPAGDAARPGVRPRASAGSISQHSQDPHLAGSTACCHEGELSGRLGLPGWPGIAEETVVARDVMLARHTGQPAARRARLHRRVGRGAPLGQGPGHRRHGRGHPAPPAADHGPPGRLRPDVQGQPAAASRRGRRGAARRARRRHHRRRRHRPRAARAPRQGARVRRRRLRDGRPRDRALRGQRGDGHLGGDDLGRRRAGDVADPGADRRPGRVRAARSRSASRPTSRWSTRRPSSWSTRTARPRSRATTPGTSASSPARSWPRSSAAPRRCSTARWSEQALARSTFREFPYATALRVAYGNSRNDLCAVSEPGLPPGQLVEVGVGPAVEHVLLGCRPR